MNEEIPKFRTWLLHPLVLYTSVFGAYILPPTVSALFFDQFSHLFLQGVWSKRLVIDGLCLFLTSVVAMGVGYRLSSLITLFKFPHINYKQVSTVTSMTLLPTLLLAIFLIGGAYFSGGYEGGGDPGSYLALDSKTRAGIAMLYFAVETFIAVLTISDWNFHKKIRPKTLLLTFFAILLVVKNMKRLEMITPILATIGFVYFDKKRSLYIIPPEFRTGG